MTKHTATYRKIDTEYAVLLQMFTSLIDVKGRPFGQRYEQLFGMSDGNEGVQWNLAILTDINQIWHGQNAFLFSSGEMLGDAQQDQKLQIYYFADQAFIILCAVALSVIVDYVLTPSLRKIVSSRLMMIRLK